MKKAVPPRKAGTLHAPAAQDVDGKYRARCVATAYIIAAQRRPACVVSGKTGRWARVTAHRDGGQAGGWRGGGRAAFPTAPRQTVSQGFIGGEMKGVS